MKKILFAITASLSIIYADIGRVTAVRGNVQITRGIALYKAHIGLELEEKDIFFTDKHASMQITFKDKTVLTLGKDTVFKVDEYLYKEGDRKSKAKFQFRKGFFKSITGRIGKISPDKFKIKTKNSTIGIRGTEILGNSTNDKEDIVCTNGEIAVETGDKVVVAKKDEKIEVALDPRIDYTVATAMDVVVQAQVQAGLKKIDDPDVIGRPTDEVVLTFKPQYKKEMAKKGVKLDIKKVKPVSIMKEAVVIPLEEKKEIEKSGFVVSAKDFKSQDQLREDIKVFTQELKEEEKKQKTQDPDKTGDGVDWLNKEAKRSWIGPDLSKHESISPSKSIFQPIPPETIATVPFVSNDILNNDIDQIIQPAKDLNNLILNWNVPSMYITQVNP